MLRLPALVALILCVGVRETSPQGTPPPAQASVAFEVGSIRPNRSDESRGGLRVQPGGRYTWTNTTLRSLIDLAYQREALYDREVVDGPAWIERDRFDVLAKAPEGVRLVDPTGFPGPLLAMVRSLLADRFGLRVHNDVRERPAYALVTARSDRRPGARLRAVTDGCLEAMKAMSEGRPAAVAPGRGPACTFGGQPGEVLGNAVTLTMFAKFLSGQVQRPVFDRTGVTGSFDVDLSFAPDFVPARGSGPPSDPVATDAPSIFTALQEQLGLKLESTRAPVDVLVVDGATLPTPD